jgi:anhydro-N-acetylmuramic acid kinase
MSRSICLGLMSGTSMDGIDAALINTDGDESVESIASSFYPYPDVFQRCLKQVEAIIKQTKGDLDQAAIEFSQSSMATDQELKNLFSEYELSTITLNNLILLSTYLHQKISEQILLTHGIDHAQISLIGYHGQTLYHAPQEKKTLQVGDCQLLADKMNIPVVGHFRYNDIRHNGQGAPITPIYNLALAKKEGLIPMALLNCGGIANVSLILSESERALIAFDTGPGNVLLDRFVREKTHQQHFFDQNGQWSLAGQINQTAFNDLLSDSLPKNYLTKAPPKSLDSYDCRLPEIFDHLTLEDGCATLAAFSAECMVRCLDFCDQPPRRFILAGGGLYNAAILNQFKIRLETRLQHSPQILTAQQIGWQQDMLEAEAFAYLAKRVENKLPLTFPGTTGVAQALTGGEIFYPKKT